MSWKAEKDKQISEIHNLAQGEQCGEKMRQGHGGRHSYLTLYLSCHISGKERKPHVRDRVAVRTRWDRLHTALRHVPGSWLSAPPYLLQP